jgi:glycosyltransferase involved in cell wall biosynthesis
MGQKISIIIPTRNRPKLLIQRAVKSVLWQSYSNWELIIVGDDCDVDVVRKIKKSLPEDSRIHFYNLSPKVYHYPNDSFHNWLVGPVKALNYGLSKCDGDWIARLDDDDIWMPNMLSKMLAFALAGKYDFVSATYLCVKRPGFVEISKPYLNPKVGGVQTWLYRSKLKKYKYSLDSWKKDWDCNNEIDLYKRMYEDGVKFGYLNSVVAVILPRPGLDTIGSVAYVSEKRMAGDNTSKGWLKGNCCQKLKGIMRKAVNLLVHKSST